MQDKIKVFSMNHKGREKIEQQIEAHLFDRVFDYGNLTRLTLFRGSHPAVMKDWIARFDWKDQLRYSGPVRSMNPVKSKHDRFKYRIISWIEKYLLFGNRLGEFRNYILLGK
ncbi:MAG TPA: hypothetical protein ENO20_03515 [Bacteroides sp.]|nr:hypothetical protein [Bacteroides sp.]